MSAWAQDVFREMSYSPKQTVFFLNSPKRPTLSLWSDGLGGKPLRTVKMRADGKRPQQRQRMGPGAEREDGGRAAFFHSGVIHAPILSQRLPLGNGEERKVRCACA